MASSIALVLLLCPVSPGYPAQCPSFWVSKVSPGRLLLLCYFLAGLASLLSRWFFSCQERWRREFCFAAALATRQKLQQRSSPSSSLPASALLPSLKGAMAAPARPTGPWQWSRLLYLARACVATAFCSALASVQQAHSTCAAKWSGSSTSALGLPCRRSSDRSSRAARVSGQAFCGIATLLCSSAAT